MRSQERTTPGTAPLLTLLRAKYAPPDYVLITEVANATGGHASRWADAVVMGVWPSRGLELMGFELKASRSDWLRELKDPSKADAVCRYCDRWWIVAADVKVVADGELPPTWGLMVPRGNGMKVIMPARELEPEPISRGFLADLLRKAAQNPDAKAIARKIQEAEWRGQERANKAHEEREKRHINHDAEALQILTAKVNEFEKATGLHVGSWDLKPIGAAVNALRNGSAKDQMEQVIRSLEKTAAGLRDALNGMETMANLKQEAA